MIRVLILEERRLLKEGIEALIDQADDISTIRAGSNTSVMKTIENERPDVILMDLDVPGDNAIQVMVQIKDLNPDVKVILLTTEIVSKLIIRAIHKGADGILLKGLCKEQLLRVIREAYEGEHILSGKIAGVLVQKVKETMFDKKQMLAAALANRNIYLNKGQLEVGYLLSKGYSNIEMSEKLHFTDSTIKNYVSDIYAKIRIRNRAEARDFLQKIVKEIEVD
jgi:DNA-binding NarL/FixJ family response regulator